jgi:NADPH:quinone reductase-like Zn-dependent oxidoreductase
MRALALLGPGDAPGLVDLTAPVPSTDEVLVAVQSSSINPHDRMVASGGARRYLEYRYPVILGTDFAGEVVACGDGVSDLGVGDRVLGLALGPVASHGSYADLLSIHRDNVAPIVDGVDIAEAGTCGLAGVTALACSEALGELGVGSRVIVHGAAGGVGSLLVQLLHRSGADVLATSSSAAGGRLLESLGCHDVLVVDGGVGLDTLYRHAVSGHTLAGGFTAVVDLVTTDSHLLGRWGARLLPTGGAIISTRHAAPTDVAGVHGRNIVAQSTRASLEALAGLLGPSELRVQINRSLGLGQVASALSSPSSGPGKVAVDLGL